MSEAELVDLLQRSLRGERPPVIPRRPVGIGSTDIASIAALYQPELADELPKNKTAGDVWLNAVHGIEVRRDSRMHRGLRVERSLLEAYSQATGRRWWRPALAPEEWWSVRHPQYSWAFCSPDGLNRKDGEIVIEAKSQSVWARNQWGLPGTDQMATRFLYQCVWQMACCDAEECHLIVGFGTDDKESGEFFFTESAVYRARRDRVLEARLLEYGERFFNDYVRTGIPPPVRSARNRREWKRLTRRWFE